MEGDLEWKKVKWLEDTLIYSWLMEEGWDPNVLLQRKAAQEWSRHLVCARPVHSGGCIPRFLDHNSTLRRQR